MNRRDWLGGLLVASNISKQNALAIGAHYPVESHSIGEASLNAASSLETPERIYELLGFATMTGEDPLTMWARLKNTQTWLAGPLSPDAWCGQCFIADNIDIFAFRFLSIPQKWMEGANTGNPAAYSQKQMAEWFRGWPSWWRVIGPKAPDDSYARLIWQMPDSGPKVTYEWAKTGSNEIVCRVTNSIPSGVLLHCYIPWDHNPPKLSVLYSGSPDKKFIRGRSWVPGTRDGMRWVLALSDPFQESVGTATGNWTAFRPDTTTLYLCAKQGQAYEELEAQTSEWLRPSRIDELLQNNLERYEARRPIGKGWLADVPAAINDQLEWSEVYTLERRHTYITVSRGWSRSNNSAPDFLWDSFLSALLVCQEDKEKARALVRDITGWQSERGMFCQYGQWVDHPENEVFPVAWGHTQYPIGALAVSKLYLRHPDKEFLADIYPRLLKAHRWWFSDRGDGQPWRDGNKDGLLELGSNYPAEIPYEDRQQVAYFESHDDSPQWWHVARYNNDTNTIELNTVERNCLYAMDAWVLAWIAHELGRHKEAAALESEHAQMAERINRLMWNPESNCYFNRRWAPVDGSWFTPQMAPDIFFSLLGKVAPPDRAEHLRKIFHDPSKFAGEWILPTISRDDPMYPQQHYWRGKVWGPINWLVYQGFKIHDWDEEAQMLAKSSAKIFLKPWRDKGECHENFLSTTGEGSSDPHYTWGALMVLIAIEELIDANPWQGLRFGNLIPVEEAEIGRYRVGEFLYDVHLYDRGLEVQRDGKPLFSADAPVEIKQVRFNGKRVTGEVRTVKPVAFTIGVGQPRKLESGSSKFEGFTG
jgi:glycogen debranching enzyme